MEQDRLETLVRMFTAYDEICTAIVAQDHMSDGDDERHSAALIQVEAVWQEILAHPIRDATDAANLADLVAHTFGQAAAVDDDLPDAEMAALLRKLADRLDP